MKLIVGLGNPGPKYENTRHNVGYLVLDKLSEIIDAEESKSGKFDALISSANTNDDKTILAKPTTYINLSGRAVQQLTQFYKISPEDVWIIYDDIDLPIGQIRIRKKGGPGTHNGMKSIVDHIGQNFPRFRVGIESRGESAPEQQDISSFVLSPFTKEEEETAQEAIEKAANAVKYALDHGLEEAMNKFNTQNA